MNRDLHYLVNPGRSDSRETATGERALPCSTRRNGVSLFCRTPYDLKKAQERITGSRTFAATAGDAAGDRTLTNGSRVVNCQHVPHSSQAPDVQPLSGEGSSHGARRRNPIWSRTSTAERAGTGTGRLRSGHHRPGGTQSRSGLSEYLGHQTNNVAEYSGLLAALDYAIKNGSKR